MHESLMISFDEVYVTAWLFSLFVRFALERGNKVQVKTPREQTTAMF